MTDDRNLEQSGSVDPLPSHDLRDRILSHEPRLLAVDVDGKGTIHLRRPTLRDMDGLGRLVSQDMSPRDFAEAVLRNQWATEDSALSLLSSWKEADVADLLREWTQHVPKIGARDLNTLQTIQVALGEAYEEWVGPIKEIGEQVAERLRGIKSLAGQIELVPPFQEINAIARSIGSLSLQLTPHLDELTQTLRDVVDRIRLPLVQISIPAVELGRLFDSFPDPQEIQAWLGEVAEGADTLEGLGYGFAADRWAPIFVRRVGRGQVGHQAVHHEFRAYTRSDEFRERCEGVILRSPRMRRRWRDLGPALEAHRQRQYALSVPVLLAQLEGILTDLLIVKGRAVSRGKQILEKHKGRVRRGRDGKVVLLRGLDSKSDRARSVTPADLESGIAFIADVLVPERNAILHGRRSGHGRAKLSVQLLLLIWMYAEVVAAAEAEATG